MNFKFISIFTLAFLVSFPALAESALFERDLYFGLRNDPDVTRLQQFLTDQKIYSGPITGNFFSLTQAAVKQFQEKNNIVPAAGYFGPKTRAVANQKPSLAEQIKTLQDLVASLQKQLAELQVQEAAVSPPAPVLALPNPFESTLKIETTYSSLTLSSFGDKVLTAFKVSADEKIAITKIRFKNKGTYKNIYLVKFKLLENSDSGPVLAEADISSDGIVEFKLIANDAKENKGLIVSGNSYYVRAYLTTYSYGAEKPYIRLDIESASDVSAFDYNDLSRVADISKANTFPIRGPQITAF